MSSTRAYLTCCCSDYKKYISDRLLDVEDIDKRSQIRKAVTDMLIPFYEHIEPRNITYKKLIALKENGDFTENDVKSILEQNLLPYFL